MDPAVALEVTQDYYQPLVPSVLFMSLWPSPSDGFWNSEVKAEAKPWFKTNQKTPGAAFYEPYDDVPSDSAQFARFEIASRIAYYTAFLYMCMMLRQGSLSSFILKLLIDQLLDDAERTVPAFLENRCNRSVWIWTMMLTLAAVASAPANDKLEAMQIRTWRGAINSKIRLANGVLGLDSWQSVKAHLELIAWEEGFDGEDELRRMWEDIKWQDTTSEESKHQTTLVLRNDPDYRIQYKRERRSPGATSSTVSDVPDE